MSQPRILNVEPFGYSAQARTVLLQLGDLVELQLSREELIANIGDYDVLIVRLAHQIDREIIDRGVRLKVILTATTGLDHVDIAYAGTKGIQVLSLRGEVEFLQSVSATSEHTWTLLLSLLRHVSGAFEHVRQGSWDRDKFRGCELDGKKLGIVGLGRVGRKVARYAQAFNMQVMAYDPYAQDWMIGVQRSPTLENLLQQSEILSLHVPLTAETAQMLNVETLALLPQRAIIVNTSRGEVIDELALVRFLENGHLAGVALDVINHEREPELRQKSLLIAYAQVHENIIITPHIAGATTESMANTEMFMARKLATFLTSGEDLTSGS